MNLKYVSYFWMAMAIGWIILAIIDVFIDDAASANYIVQMSFLCIIISLIVDIQNNINNLKHP